MRLASVSHRTEVSVAKLSDQSGEDAAFHFSFPEPQLELDLNLLAGCLSLFAACRLLRCYLAYTV